MISDDVKKVVGKWSTVALKSGYVDGSGEGPLFNEEQYGPEMEEALIIKKRSTDATKNWLNWMN
jgi:hypothetical protein